MRKDIRKVLIISHSFPPSGVSAAQRPLKFTKYLMDFGWIPYVVTPKRKRPPLDNRLLFEIPNDVQIYQVCSLDPVNLDIDSLKGEKSDGFQSIMKLLHSFLLKVYSVAYFRLIIVDWYDGWIPFGFTKGIEVIKKENIDLIYVHGEPPSSFIIGMLLKKVSSRPLVIDYDDSWTTSVYARREKGLKAKIQRYLENQVLKAADRAISVKQSTINEIMECFNGFSETRFDFITNGYDPEDFLAVKKTRREKLVITYTGRISEKFYYSPESFLRAIGELIKEGNIAKTEIAINFLGTISERYNRRFKSLLKEHDLLQVVDHLGFINHRGCIAHQMNSDLLLYIIESLEGKDLSYSFSGVLPAKLFEYFYTKVPILAIVPPGDEMDLIKKTGTGFIVEPNNVGAIKAMLLEIILKYRKGNLTINPNMELIGQYDRRLLTKRLAESFDVVLKECRRVK